MIAMIFFGNIFMGVHFSDEGRLPQELLSVISEGLPGLLVPPALEPGKAGLQWVSDFIHF